MDIPTFGIDLFDPEIMANPFEAYRELRNWGPVCKLPTEEIYAFGRYADVKNALSNWETFSSARGVALNETCNGFMVGTPIGSDPPDHKRFRTALGRPLEPKRLIELRPRLADLARERVREVVGAGPIDAMQELARHLPLRVISELVGLPEEGRQRMLEWAAAGFNSMGAASVAQTQEALPVMGEMVAYICDPKLPARFRTGSWSAELWSSVEKNDLSETEAQAILQGYVTPSLDTTIFTLGTILQLLASNPAQWELLKANRSLTTRCIHEALRLEGPARGFSRVLTSDLEVGDHVLPAGARVWTVLPSANRDERHYPDPDVFDISRNASDHVAFGAGIHRCVGGNLALMELSVMLEAIVDNVSKIQVLDAELADSAMLRGYRRLEVTLH